MAGSFPNVQSLWTWTLTAVCWAFRSVQVDLSPCQDGRYEILFFDAEGNEAEGSFLKEE